MSILDLQVGASTDDCDRPPFSLTEAVFFLDFTSSGQEDGARFTGVTIPQGATIVVAHVIATPSTAGIGGTPGVTITAEDADNPATFTNDINFLARSRTSASVHWGLPTFIVNIEVNSPSLVAPIQEVVDREGFGSDALILFFRGDEAAQRQCNTYNSNPTKALRLHIEYTDPPLDPTMSTGIETATPAQKARRRRRTINSPSQMKMRLKALGLDDEQT